MLCPNCGEENPLGRSHCVICSTTLFSEHKTPPTPTKAEPCSTEVIGGWIGLGLSIFAFQTAAPYIFSHSFGGGINLFQVACAAIAGGVGMILGKKLAGFFCKPKG
ncbi:MAG: hypothetical protein U1C48_07310 [Methylotenera sp.]|nr:hypothetical protein [Methylotenera sp.]